VPDAARHAARLPIVERFPAIARLPRVSLGRFPTPVQRAGALGEDLWVKRDDASGDELGGNKLRALEFLLAGLESGEDVVTVGATGSTHALATATYAKRLGARVHVFRWPQEPSDGASAVAERTRAIAHRVKDTKSVLAAYSAATLLRLRGARWIPAGGSSPLGILGHVNAALELEAQIARGALPAPTRVIVPLGSGGTSAGLLLGFAIAGIRAEVHGVRVVPRTIGNRSHVMRLVRRTKRLIERLTGERLSSPDASRFRISHDYFGGAYGRETAEGRRAAERFAEWSRARLDTTYSAKAFAAALALADATDGATLYWLTFDGRSL
jgi:D-cysteine desulfhydrase